MQEERGHRERSIGLGLGGLQHNAWPAQGQIGIYALLVRIRDPLSQRDPAPSPFPEHLVSW
jgi:hypothetical protein